MFTILKAAVSEVASAVTEAQEEAVKVLGEDDEEDDDDDSSHRPPPAPVVRDEELYDLETAVKKARKASSTTSQVRTVCHDTAQMLMLMRSTRARMLENMLFRMFHHDVYSSIMFEKVAETNVSCVGVCGCVSTLCFVFFWPLEGGLNLDIHSMG